MTAPRVLPNARKRAHKRLVDLAHDSLSCSRLSGWEEGFIADLDKRFAKMGEDIHLSDKQMEMVERIEAKVYAHG